jgi:type II secretory ATPase GspE/PulE/Tfp pilus assembly ATPase PilB-like protein
MTRTEQARLTALLSSPSGLILVTGPTGTGKTTTLYACLQHLNNGERKINTLEDPVEYAVKGVRQSQVQPALGVDFPELLTNVLRQAPDVIMIGEIRDQATAMTAVRAANSGHLVLATLHAPVAAHAVQNMLNLGAHPYFLGNCLLGVVAQRLVRVLNPQSRVAYDISESPGTFADVQSLLAPGEGQNIYGPSPPSTDGIPPYIARTGLFEVLTMNKELRRLVTEARPAEEIEQQAIEQGMIEFRRAALLKVAQGVTSIEEMMRVVPSAYLGAED